MLFLVPRGTERRVDVGRTGARLDRGARSKVRRTRLPLAVVFALLVSGLVSAASRPGESVRRAHGCGIERDPRFRSDRRLLGRRRRPRFSRCHRRCDHGVRELVPSWNHPSRSALRNHWMGSMADNAGTRTLSRKLGEDFQMLIRGTTLRLLSQNTIRVGLNRGRLITTERT